MSTKKLLPLFIFAIVTGVGTASVSAKGWEKLDSVLIDRKSDHSTIFVPNQWDHTFRMIKFTLTKGGVRITRVVATYGDNSGVEFKLNDVIPANGSTQELALPSPRYVKRVDFWYEPASLESKSATVQLWGFWQ
jgi:hypothetical protein